LALRFTDWEGAIRILFVEDDDELAARVSNHLQEAGFVVDRAADGDVGWYMGDSGAYDAAVLDLGLPRLPGLDVLKRWRTAGKELLVLVLSARAAWSERVDVLNAGADDYVTKPFHPPELVARLRALLRRGSRKTEAFCSEGDVVLDVGAGLVTVRGVPVEMTARELQILTYFMYRSGRLVSQSELIEHVYAEDEYRDSNTIQVYVARLRKKLGRETIRTVRGMGYRFGK
jgi:DNA-binding response OmpR family regulator